MLDMDLPPALSQWSQAAHERSRYAPIGTYGIVGDCRTCALVSRDGSVDWLCLPHFAGPSLFAALLDAERGGRFVVHPRGDYRADRHYLDGTNILRTRFRTPTGTLTLTDLMPVAGTALEPQRELLRVVEASDGPVELEVLFEPRPDYARARPPIRRRGALGWACEHRSSLFNLLTDLPLAPNGDATALYGRLRLAAGERRYLSLVYTHNEVGVIAPLGRSADQRTLATHDWWRQWSGRCRYSGPYRNTVLRSVLLLKLLTYTLSGAVVAAPTTSLPERPGGVRNWDYRYCWLRDVSMTLRAFADLGYPEEAGAFFDWLLHATRLTGAHLNALYDLHGETHIPEQELGHLHGYRDSRPVRIGNGAWTRLQLDVYGEVALSAYAHVRQGGRLDRAQQRVLRGIGRVVCDNWRRPDQGLWEMRGEARHYTHSKVMCWVALDRLLRLHQRGALWVPRERFEREARAIRAAIETRGYDQALGAYVGAFDAQWLDAGLLLMARYGYQNATAPRMQSTFARIDERLTRDGLVYRYRDVDDHLPPGEGAFTACGFWAVDYLARCGRLREAARRFEHLLAAGNDVGLFAEEIDPDTGEALGNLPQAFSHVGLITAALALETAAAGASVAGGDY